MHANNAKNVVIVIVLLVSNKRHREWMVNNHDNQLNWVLWHHSIVWQLFRDRTYFKMFWDWGFPLHCDFANSTANQLMCEPRMQDIIESMVFVAQQQQIEQQKQAMPLWCHCDVMHVRPCLLGILMECTGAFVWWSFLLMSSWSFKWAHYIPWLRPWNASISLSHAALVTV